MLRFVEMNEVCLPVHNSFIVRRGMQTKLLEVMQAEFERATGTTIKITSAMGGDGDGFGTLSDSIQPTPGEPEVNRHRRIAFSMQNQRGAAHSGELVDGRLQVWRHRGATRKAAAALVVAVDRQPAPESFQPRPGVKRNP